MMRKRRGTAEIATVSLQVCAASNRHKIMLFSTRSIALFGNWNMRPEAIFELRRSARIPLARPGGAGHDGKTSCCGSNRNAVANRLRSQQSTQKPALFNSLAYCVHQVKHGPEAISELRWSARIPLARPGGAGHDGKTSWYGSNHNGVAGMLRNQQSTQKPALFSQLARSLCTAGETYS